MIAGYDFTIVAVAAYAHAVTITLDCIVCYTCDMIGVTSLTLGYSSMQTICKNEKSMKTVSQLAIVSGGIE